MTWSMRMWAKCGTTYDPASWRMLVRITHWTADDVARAQQAQETYGATEPDIVLNEGFDELLEHFSFVSMVEPKSPTPRG